MEIKIVKGCGKSQDFSANGTNEDVFGAYSESRRCWTSNVHAENFDLTNKGYEIQCFKASQSIVWVINIFGYRSVDIQVDQNEYQTKTDKIQEALATVTVFDFSQSSGMKEELKFSSPISDNSDIKWQSQTCICDLGDLCNFSTVLNSCSLSVLLVMTMTVLILTQ